MKRRGFVFAGVAATLLGVVALAHVPGVRGALGGSSCPWSGRPPSAEKLEDLRRKSAASLKGTRAAAARPAFGFTLDRTTKAEVAEWAAKNAFTCAEELGGAAMRCESAASVVRDVFLRFDPGGRLVAVDAVHAGTTPAAAAEQLSTIASSLEAAAGPPALRRGAASAEHLGSGRLSQAAVEFRFSDYAADVVATTFGESDVVVREQYRSLAN